MIVSALKKRYNLYLGAYPDHECHHSALMNLPFHAHAHDSDPSPYLSPYAHAFLYPLLIDPYLILILIRDHDHGHGLDHDDLLIYLYPETYRPNASLVHPLLGKHPSNLSVLIVYHLPPSLFLLCLHDHMVVSCPMTYFVGETDEVQMTEDDKRRIGCISEKKWFKSRPVPVVTEINISLYTSSTTDNHVAWISEPGREGQNSS